MLTLQRRVFLSFISTVIALSLASCDDDPPTKPPDVKPETWDLVISAPGDDAFNAVTSLSDGNYLAVGYTNSNGAVGEDFFAVKFTPDGDTLWSRHYGGSGGDIGLEAVGTPDGGAVLAGLSNSFGASGLDIWIVKIDSAGDTLWSHSFGSTGLDGINDLTVTSDNAVIAVGMIATGSDRRAWAAKFAPDGTILWDNQYLGSSNAALATVTELSDNNLFMSCMRYGTIPFASWQTLTPGGDSVSSFWYLFQAGFYIQSMAIGLDDRITIAGSYLASTTQPRYDFFALRIGANNQRLWDKKYGGAEDDQCHAILPLLDGNLMMMGNTRSYDGPDWDMYVIEIDTTGAVVNETVIKDDLETEMQDALATPDGKYLVVGSQALSAGEHPDAMIRKMEL